MAYSVVNRRSEVNSVFSFVVVDVISGDDFTLGGLAGLAGAQDNADVRVVEFAPNEVNQLKPGLLGLHDHIEQHHGHVGMIC